MGCTQSKTRDAVTERETIGAANICDDRISQKKKQLELSSDRVDSFNGDDKDTIRTAGTPSTSGSSTLPIRPRLDLDSRSNSSRSLSNSSSHSVGKNRRGLANNDDSPFSVGLNITRSNSAIGLDKILDDRREVGDLRQNIVRIEARFGKPIEEVYDGVHDGPLLGVGISGEVRLITHKATGINYAVKVLDLGLIDSAEGLARLREEIMILSRVDHPNIVRLEEVYESHSEIYLVQELCLGGDLFDRLEEQPDYRYTEKECARLVKQMLSAVSHCHSRGIVHRDLKLENFLFASTAKDSELKMIDFGLSKFFQIGEVLDEAVGTPYAVAPEVIRGCYDERCDIWAIGVIAYFMLSGDPPFGGCGGPETIYDIRDNVLLGRYSFEPKETWCRVSQMAKEFIKALLVNDPLMRPTVREARKLKWLRYWASRARCNESDHVLNPNVVKALVNFKEYSDMRKLLCEVLSFTMLPDQIKDLRKEFEKIDTDGSGEISLEALTKVLLANAGTGSLGSMMEEEVEEIFNAMRVKKSEKSVCWHEFIAAGLSQCEVDDRNLRLAFGRLDIDHKGYITLDDIMDLMGSDSLQNEESVLRMWSDSIHALKCNQTHITFQDFLLLMKGQINEHSASRNSEILGIKEKSNLITQASGIENYSMTSLGVNSDDAVCDVPETVQHKSGKVDRRSLSGLQVNRHFHLANREMRLAILEASKRFEESQAIRTRAKEEQKTEQRSYRTQAGLVMRNERYKHLSSDDIAGSFLRHTDPKSKSDVFRMVTSKILDGLKDEPEAVAEYCDRTDGDGVTNAVRHGGWAEFTVRSAIVPLGVACVFFTSRALVRKS